LPTGKFSSSVDINNKINDLIGKKMYELRDKKTDRVYKVDVTKSSDADVFLEKNKRMGFKREYLKDKHLSVKLGKEEGYGEMVVVQHAD
jgi:hypothetical protein